MGIFWHEYVVCIFPEEQLAEVKRIAEYEDKNHHLLWSVYAAQEQVPNLLAFYCTRHVDQKTFKNSLNRVHKALSAIGSEDITWGYGTQEWCTYEYPFPSFWTFRFPSLCRRLKNLYLQ